MAQLSHICAVCAALHVLCPSKLLPKAEMPSVSACSVQTAHDGQDALVAQVLAVTSDALASPTAA